MSADLARRLRAIKLQLGTRDEAHFHLEAAAYLLETKPNQPDNAPFWIVVALDDPNPGERGTRPYVRQPDEATAKKEARRLAGEYGGRFAVLRVMHVIGWQEVQMDAADLQLPF